MWRSWELRQDKRKVVSLLYCEICARPVSRRQVRRLDFFDLPLCEECYQRCLETLHKR